MINRMATDPDKKDDKDKPRGGDGGNQEPPLEPPKAR